MRRLPLVGVVPTILTLLSSVACQSSAVSSVPPPAGTLVATIHQNHAQDIVSGFGSIWVSNGPSGTVTRIDPVTDASVALINLDDPPSVLAVSPDAVWVTSFSGVSVTRIDPLNNKVVGTVNPGGDGPIGIEFFDGYVWVANHDGVPRGSVAKIDPVTMKVVDQIYVGDAADSGPVWIAAGAGSLWVGVTNIAAVVRIDPLKDNILSTISDNGVLGEIVADDHDVWVAGGDGRGVTHIDPATNLVSRAINEVGFGVALAVGAGSVWFGTDTTLDRINPTSHKLVSRLKLPGGSNGATVGFGYVWVTDKNDGLLLKIKPG